METEKLLSEIQQDTYDFIYFQVHGKSLLSNQKFHRVEEDHEKVIFNYILEYLHGFEFDVNKFKTDFQNAINADLNSESYDFYHIVFKFLDSDFNFSAYENLLLELISIDFRKKKFSIAYDLYFKDEPNRGQLEL